MSDVFINRVSVTCPISAAVESCRPQQLVCAGKGKPIACRQIPSNICFPEGLRFKDKEKGFLNRKGITSALHCGIVELLQIHWAGIYVTLDDSI